MLGGNALGVLDAARGLSISRLIPSKPTLSSRAPNRSSHDRSTAAIWNENSDP